MLFSSNYTLDELTAEEIQEMESDSDASKNEIEPESIENIETPISIDTKQSFNQWLHADINYEEKELEDKKRINSIAQHSENEKKRPVWRSNKTEKRIFLTNQKSKGKFGRK